MRIFTLLLTLFLSTTAFAQNHLRTSWSFVAGTVGEESVRAIETDAQGNIYVGGYFSGLIDFDPGPGTFNLQSNGSNADAFLLKLDPNGNFLWAKSFRGSNNDYEDVYRIAFDNSGNVYASGNFQRNIQFNQGGIYFQGITGGTHSSYLVKLDSLGNYQWAHTWSGSATNEQMGIQGVITDNVNNIYCTGYFVGTVDFDPDTTVSIIKTSTKRNIYVLKLDSSGAFADVAIFNGNGNGVGNAISIDASGKLYITGGFDKTVDFDPGPDSTKVSSLSNGSAFDYNAFILKLNSNLDFVWVKSFGNSDDTFISRSEISPDGFLYSVGVFQSTVDFDLNSTTNGLRTAVGLWDSFIQKIDTSGVFQWVKTVSADRVYTYYMKVNANGKVAITGGFSGSDLQLDGNNYVKQSINNNYSEAFVASYASNGDLLAGEVFGSSNNDYARAVSFAQNGDLLVGGFYKGTMDIDPTAGVNQVTCSGADDMFLLRLSACATTDSVVATACDTFVTYTGKTITTSGWHGDTLTTTQGCDSVTYYDVTIHSSNFGLQIWQQGATLFSSVNNANGKQYQWIDCTTKQAVSGATDSAFSPAQNGTYALVVDDGNCTDTSTCRTTSGIGLAENSMPQVSLFPNPTTGLLQIKTSQEIQKIQVVDLVGREVIYLSNPENQIDLSTLHTGIYLVKIYFQEGVVVSRVVKE